MASRKPLMQPIRSILVMGQSGKPRSYDRAALFATAGSVTVSFTALENGNGSAHLTMEKADALSLAAEIIAAFPGSLESVANIAAEIRDARVDNQPWRMTPAESVNHV